MITQKTFSVLTTICDARFELIRSLGHIFLNKFLAYCEFTHDGIDRPSVRLRLQVDGANLIEDILNKALEQADDPDNKALLTTVPQDGYEAVPLSLYLTTMAQAAKQAHEFLTLAAERSAAMEKAAGEFVPDEAKHRWSDWESWNKHLEELNTRTAQQMMAINDIPRP